MALPARLMWKDQRGTTRFASVVARNVSEHGVYVECQSAVSIPMYRLVQFQLEREAREGDVPPRRCAAGACCRRSIACRPATTAGSPQGLALRLMVEPRRTACRRPRARRRNSQQSASRQSAVSAGRQAGRSGLPFFLQYRASPRQFRSNRPASSYACVSALFIRRLSSRRTSSANHASRSSSVPSRASDVFDKRADELDVIAQRGQMSGETATARSA